MNGQRIAPVVLLVVLVLASLPVARAESWPQNNCVSIRYSFGFNIRSQFSEYGPLRKRDGDPQLGVEVGYSRSLVRLGKTERFQAVLGLEGGFGFTDLTMEGSSSETATIQSSGFGLPGIIVPNPPYNGGPGGPIIIDPGPGPVSGTATITAVNRLDGQLYRLMVGPYLEFGAYQRVSLVIGGGVAFAAADMEYSFQQTVVGATFALSQTDKSADVHCRLGGYAKAMVKVRVVKNWHAVAGVTYQNLGNISQAAGAGRSELGLNQSLFLNLGVGCSF